MPARAFQLALGAAVLLLLVSASVFQVKETELAIKFRLRDIAATDYEPGLHFMVPWLESVQKFDRRVLTRNYPAEPFLTSEGKFLEKYQTEINTLQVAPGDMERLGLAKGDRVRLTSQLGQEVEVAVAPAKKDELPEGLLFIAYGDISSRLMGGDTHGSGMPTSKGLDVLLEVIAK